MKILTNIQSVNAGGIAQSMLSFQRFLEKNDHKDIDLIGIDIVNKESKKEKTTTKRMKSANYSLISKNVFYRKIHNVLLEINTLTQLKKEYRNVIATFEKIIKEESPDLIVLNGTYIIPWCLYQAAKKTSVPILLHYHGMITKETETWDAHSNLIMKKMEQTFDNSHLKYIFPSELAKKVVETEIFGHKISNTAILANSIPSHFFDIKTTKASQNIGVVGRWTGVKNPNFVMQFAKYNSENDDFFRISMVTNSDHISKKDKYRLRFVNMHENMNSTDLGKFYSGMGVIICPSTYESYGNVPQEAIASGTPALVGNNMGIAEVFRRMGLDNFIVDFSSVENIYEKAKDASKQRVDKKIRKKMREEFSSQNINTELLNIYKKAAIK